MKYFLSVFIGNTLPNGDNDQERRKKRKEKREMKSKEPLFLIRDLKIYYMK
jgi:hypothetical protein